MSVIKTSGFPRTKATADVATKTYTNYTKYLSPIIVRIATTITAIIVEQAIVTLLLLFIDIAGYIRPA